MFYDLNLHEDFADFGELASVDCRGYCMAAASSPVDSPPVYTRVNVQYDSKLDSAAMARHRAAYDIVCITTDSMACMPTIVKLRPDVVQIAIEAVRHLRKTFAGMLAESGAYVELCIRDGLYARRALWMNACRRLLRLGCRRRLVISSGASVFTELRGRDDVLRILALFGLGGASALAVLSNGRAVLRQAALRRYAVGDAVATAAGGGRLKHDFIIAYQKQTPARGGT